jgi:hypothetical protein
MNGTRGKGGVPLAVCTPFSSYPVSVQMEGTPRVSAALSASPKEAGRTLQSCDAPRAAGRAVEVRYRTLLPPIHHARHLVSHLEKEQERE